MLRTWVFGSVAVTVEEIDFHDPALVGQPDIRERGVRLEVRYVDTDAAGSIYASPTLTLRPAVCRIDLLESRPHAADRMHWHPVMSAGEPEDRLFDTTMVEDPLQWLREKLRSVDDLLLGNDVPDLVRRRADADAIAVHAEEIIGVVRDALARMRQPWPKVEHDERGMAVVRTA